MSEYKNALPMRAVQSVERIKSKKANVYKDTLGAFLELNTHTVELDLDTIGIKAPTLRVGMMRAIEELGLQDKVEVSIRPSIGKVYLTRTDADASESYPEHAHATYIREAALCSGRLLRLMRG